MAKTESTVPGLQPLPGRNKAFKTPYAFLEGRRQIDGAEGLWRIGNNLYDLETFEKHHPGGKEWISLTKGTDITELFEAHHLTEKPSRILPKYFIKEAVSSRSVPLTFKPNGFYYTFKKRALEALKNVDFHRPSKKSNAIADLMVTLTIAISLAAVFMQSRVIVAAAGISLAWTTIIAHNYFHMRDNFRMYYFDLCGMSSKEWRITHAMSHHTYPNTVWDYEIYIVEPLIQWLPDKEKSTIKSFISQILSPAIWTIFFIGQLIKRYYSAYYEFKTFDLRDVVPFVLPVLMSSVAPSILVAVKYWLLILVVSSFVFSMIGFNAAHHHPDIFHDGDIYRDDLDWGLLELDAVRERKVVDDSDFLVLTNFGQHALHHLLPTVDHSYLPLCIDAFQKTCKEFGISTEKYTQWELVKGQFRQLMRKEQKKNHR
ncbi:cytochrome b5-related [Nomia melanderi]|uniref:cytochrome b5-related n=1 Tax=Nomia melanderi TaxID=2448451 RepID=UPI00130440E5|nr:cytochrome b5-related protein-like isoform X2 [Nomia melanderi]XP_031843725.1 cytochrome b5-related protein-like isoform X2 [Nomia melanderi]XP_031843726.1 cytochrome b5-related protein-like isoform X2 [Nomia melanderi]XP_031843727.1 cytochrome b5-related protein-like isoform X2 [Nomia melanderi]